MGDTDMIVHRIRNLVIDRLDEVIDLVRALLSPRLAMLLIIDFQMRSIPTMFVRRARIRYVNKAFCEMVGYSQHDLRGKQWVEYVVSNDPQARNATYTQDVIQSFTNRWRRSDGQMVHIEWSSVRVNGWILARVLKHEVSQ